TTPLLSSHVPPRAPSPPPTRRSSDLYQHRVVNPWAVPLQKPHPRVWIPGVLSKETIVWAAKKRYPYIALSTAIDATKKIWELYRSEEHTSELQSPDQLVCRLLLAKKK